MTLAPYIIVSSSSLSGLVVEVQLKMAQGYKPAGGPFHVGPYNPPHGGLAQAMVHDGTFQPPATKAKR